jgi:hypothetical protein
MNLIKFFQQSSIVFPFINELINMGIQYKTAAYITARLVAHSNKDRTLPSLIGFNEIPASDFTEGSIFPLASIRKFQIREIFCIKKLDVEKINPMEIQDCLFYENRKVIGYNPVVAISLFGSIIEQINNEKNGIKNTQLVVRGLRTTAFNAETPHDLFNSLCSDLNAGNDINAAIYKDAEITLNLTDIANIKLFIFLLSLYSSTTRTRYQLFGYYKSIHTFGNGARAFIKAAIDYKNGVKEIIPTKTLEDRMYNVIAWHLHDLSQNIKRGSGMVELTTSQSFREKSKNLFHIYFQKKCANGAYFNIDFPTLQDIESLFGTAEFAGKNVPVDYVIIKWLETKKQ